MKCLFIHNNFPAQFIHLAGALARRGHETVFLSSHRRKDINLPTKWHFVAPRQEKKGKSQSHESARELFFTAEAFASAMLKMKKGGFQPDLVIAHPGWGGALYVKDVFPNAGYVAYCEWYYNKGELHRFWGKGRDNPAGWAPNRHRNFYQASALLECDAAISPTYWQHSQYPAELAGKIQVVHDGIDTGFFSPGGESGQIGDLDLAKLPEIVTYATRGMEPYRGFPQFYRAIPRILAERPDCHIVIMADDRICYGSKRPDGKTWLNAMREQVPQAQSERVHFLPYGNYHNYRKLLRFSSVHVYLTAPFVLSWSMLEAMSCGCLLVASDTPPVREVVRHGQNGLLTSFWDSDQLARRVTEALEKDYTRMRLDARETITGKYGLEAVLPEQMRILERVLARKL